MEDKQQGAIYDENKKTEFIKSIFDLVGYG